MDANYPVFAICGFSGSGKTTVIEELVRILTQRGLKVAVVKHDGHGLNIDHEGKDTDRFFKAGSDVLIRGPEQSFLRMHRDVELSLEDVIGRIGPYYDLVLVEGHKGTPIHKKVWFCTDEGEDPPPEASGVCRKLRRDEDRLNIVLSMIDEWLSEVWLRQPVYVGILVGGKSTRMGSPKHLLPINDSTFLEHIVAIAETVADCTVILGEQSLPDELASLPVLPDVPGLRGPLAGMLSAVRWAPIASWIFIACDMPLISKEALRWLLDMRRPGVWGILPSLEADDGKVEPLLAYYDHRAGHLLERCRFPSQMQDYENIIFPRPSADMAKAWSNLNVPEQLSIVTSSKTLKQKEEQ
ncbi:molybdopterin-guanine dinucleotide biosynthesis protein B [bacterium E08(2017)]|nr:molybdopterin-guanine dinucleotide biosynthesis protein B [bacterium E08(2017)]